MLKESISPPKKEIPLKEVLHNVLNVKTELKIFIEAREVRLALKLEELKNRIKTLENENNKLKTEIENLLSRQ